jgi:maltooligosyltrehalose trehalohydrolase
VNFDGPESDEVRAFFLGNALHWVREYHIDGFRLDAIHAIVDRSARPFLEELSEAMDRESETNGRNVVVVGESNRNDARLVRGRQEGGIGLHGVWADDLHHALHALLTGEARGYYQDFGELSDLEMAYRERFSYAGRYSSFRRRTWGRSAEGIPTDRFVVFSQNHDQVGNRLRGDRLSSLLHLSSSVGYQALGLAAMTVLLSPCVPLLFMGEEYGETAPFPYFTSHSDPELAEAVRLGRIQEFSGFQWHGTPPDPQAEETFRTAILDRDLRLQPGHAQLLALHRELLFLRKTHPALASRRPEDVKTQRIDEERTLLVWRRNGDAESLQVLSFARVPRRIHLPLGSGRWRLLLDTTAEGWGGVGSTTPHVIESAGEVVLAVNPWSGLLLERIR